MPTCLIIGVGTGLSRSTASRFASEGYDVGLIARRADVIAPLCAELNEMGIRAARSCADAGDSAELLEAIAFVEGCIGATDVLIYNASVMRSALPFDLTSDELRSEFEVNVVGAFVAARAVAPAMTRKGVGAILFTGGGLRWNHILSGLHSQWARQRFAVSPSRCSRNYRLKVCMCRSSRCAGLSNPGGPFDPDQIAAEYWRLATASKGVEDRELIYQPDGTDPNYNDPERTHMATTITPAHIKG